MAFTSRSARVTVPSPSNTSIGPGAYSVDYDHRVDHGHAPFCSTAQRDLGFSKPSLITPGPGTYYSPTHGQRPKNLMNQTAPRFQPKDYETLPGPGTYELPSAFKKKTKRPRSADNSKANVSWFRSATAPSIPIPAQAHGYEETPTGELVPQKPPVRGYAGRSGDTVGPGAYDVIEAANKLHTGKGTDFGKSRTRRSQSLDLLHKEEGPGPGQYSFSQVADQPPKLRKPTATFVSRVLRAHQAPKVEEEETPGPGAYDHHTYHAIKPKSVPEVLQCFGSTSRRLADASYNTMAPGPGAYKVTWDAPKRRILQDVNRAPFASSSSRFKGGIITSNADELPGPGQYISIEKHDFVSDMAKNKFGRGSHFGSTTRRFQPKDEKKEEEERPGPGAYEQKQPKFIAGTLRKGPSSVFASSSDRFKKIIKEREQQPAPGQYDVPSMWSPQQLKKGKAIVSTSPRFKQQPSDNDPGPGAYSLSTNTIEYKLNTQKEKPAGFGTADRFQGGIINTKALKLGPGQYNPVDPYGGFIKRSFNVTIETSLL